MSIVPAALPMERYTYGSNAYTSLRSCGIIYDMSFWGYLRASFLSAPWTLPAPARDQPERGYPTTAPLVTTANPFLAIYSPYPQDRKNSVATGTNMIDVMLSSTISDMIPDRKAIMSAFNSTNLVRMQGIDPIPGPAYGSSPYVATAELAEHCHLYILLLGRRYGPRSEFGKSATELEYDAAYKDDPTKILIFRKATRPEPAQQQFIDRVSEYHRGYYLREYRRPPELGEIALQSLIKWIEDRAALGSKLDYFDHFIRLAIQKSPFPGVRPTYVVGDDHLELKYRFLGKSYTIHFDKGHLYRDFWGSMATLERRFESWRMIRLWLSFTRSQTLS